MDIDHEKIEIIKNKLNGSDPYVKFLSKNERKRIILIELLEAPSYITGEYLCEKTGVSRSTLLEDIDEIREGLEEKEIYIEGKPSLGYIIRGNEEKIRELIGQILLSDVDRFQLMDLFKKENFLKDKGITNLREDLNLTNDVDIEDIKYAINMSKNIYGFWILYSSYISLLRKTMLQGGYVLYLYNYYPTGQVR